MTFKNRFFLSAVAIVLVVPLIGFANLAHASTVITTCNGLMDINNNLAGDYVLGNDIDCSGIADWSPLGTFTGKLDGQGHEIAYLTVLGYVNGNSFFGNLDGAKIYNLSFRNASVETNFVGGILTTAASNHTKIVNVHVEGVIKSGAALSLTGGLVGVLNNSNIYYSSADVYVKGYEALGGLVGVTQNNSSINNSWATGLIDDSVMGVPTKVGGLVGVNSSSVISDSYASTNIAADGDIAGGLVGVNDGTSLISRSYSSGSVTSTDTTHLGGLVAVQNDTASAVDSYWDTQTSGQATSQGGTGKTTLQMKTQATFTGWDFSHTWSITAGQYPALLVYDNPIASLTLVTQVPGTIAPNGGHFVFSATGSGLQTTYITDCGLNSTRQTQAVTLDGNPIGIDITDLKVGGNYSCEVYLQNLTDNQSNHLAIGPFHVDSGESLAGGYARKVITPEVPVIPNQQTPPVNVDQQIATPTLGVNSLLTRNLNFGLTGPDVKVLQQYLNTHGFKITDTGPGSPGKETEVFGILTRAAVIRFQKAKGINPSVGFVGPITRKIINGQ